VSSAAKLIFGANSDLVFLMMENESITSFPIGDFDVKRLEIRF
jgi:hypothetical protein